MADEKDLELYLNVGCPLVLHPEPFAASAPRFTTCVRGWSKSSYLLIDRPRINNRFAAIRENQPCIVRFLYNGLACAFDTMILDWDTRQYHSYCRISWPTKFQTVSFRKFERVRAQIPCSFQYGGNRYTGLIEDISIGGCRIRTSCQMENNTTIEVDLSLPDGCVLEQIRAAVKNVRSAGSEFLLGCQFEEDQPEVESDIAFYVTTVLERGEVRTTERQRVLIIDDNRTVAMVLRNLFEQKGVEVLPASATLDGLSRLRLSSPDAVLISQRMTDLPGIESARLVRATKGLENLPIYLYGGDIPPDEIKRAGVTLHFGQRIPAIQIAKRVLAELEKLAKQPQPAREGTP
ncbi:MAG: PilZ domain-containing protein [Candidatus Hydrogenedentes bacterium]|nr:PilZ domain-containing protein [Candidatus Hydrogenedentota bacterium]